MRILEARFQGPSSYHGTLKIEFYFGAFGPILGVMVAPISLLLRKHENSILSGRMNKV